MLQRLAEQGVRITEPREAVAQAIAAKSETFNPEALVEELRPQGLGRATVYRTLELLERAGVLTRVHEGGCHGYTVCDEGHHHHLVCRSCHQAFPVDARGVEAEIQRLAEQLRFRVDTHTVEFSGLCEACLAKAAGRALAS